jgi:hypothetical protein
LVYVYAYNGSACAFCCAKYVCACAARSGKYYLRACRKPCRGCNRKGRVGSESSKVVIVNGDFAGL